MHRRAAALGLAVACAAAVLAPSPAGAAGAKCSLVLPAKVVVDSRAEKIPYRLSSNCAAHGAAFAWWDLEQASGYGWSVLVSRAEMAAGQRSGTLTYRDTAKRGPFRGYAYSSRQADGDRLTQNMPLMQVKSACRLGLSGARSTRSGWNGYTLTVKGTIWSGVHHRYVNRNGGTVELLKRRTDGTWVLADRTFMTGTGKAVFFPKGTKKGDQFRVVVKETATTWTCGSSPHTVRS